MDFKAWKHCTLIEIPHYALYAKRLDMNNMKPTMYYTCKSKKYKILINLYLQYFSIIFIYVRYIYKSDCGHILYHYNQPKTMIKL